MLISAEVGNEGWRDCYIIIFVCDLLLISFLEREGIVGRENYIFPICSYSELLIVSVLNSGGIVFINAQGLGTSISHLGDILPGLMGPASGSDCLASNPGSAIY